MLAPQTALAAGGAHVVDDSEVETPGDCHLETWAARWSEDIWHGNVGVGCTPNAVPMLELGVMVSHIDAPGVDETAIGLGAKLNLRPAETGLGIALSGSLGSAPTAPGWRPPHSPPRSPCPRARRCAST